MDEKAEDKSEESFHNHLIFYKKLNKTILDLQKEIQGSIDPKVLEHLNGRINAIDLDQTRIRKMFPEKDSKTWKDLGN